jgi:hypothetical protein
MEWEVDEGFPKLMGHYCIKSGKYCTHLNSNYPGIYIPTTAQDGGVLNLQYP